MSEEAAIPATTISIHEASRIAAQDFDIAQADASERLRQQMTIADAAMKALLWANGGALIALFTFVGNVAVRSPGAARFDGSDLWIAFALFVAGLVLALITHALAFVSQDRFYKTAMHELWRAQRVMGSGAVEQRSSGEVRAFRQGSLAYVAAFIVAILSVIGFATGCGFALAGVVV